MNNMFDTLEDRALCSATTLTTDLTLTSTTTSTVTSSTTTTEIVVTKKADCASLGVFREALTASR